MKNMHLLFFMLLLCLPGFGQHYIYHGDARYESTKTWSFESNGQCQHYPEVCIAKRENGGYFMLSIHVPFKSNYIKGPLTIFLQDGSVIKCVDRGIRDHLDGKASALYELTPEEVEQLKTHRISKVRYSVYEGNVIGTENFSADNDKGRLSYRGNEENRYYATHEEVTELFNGE